MPALSIVIPTLGRSSVLQKVLQGLARQEGCSAEIEVLISVDATGPATLDLPELADGPGCRVLHAERPGASAARNAGWRAASSPLVLFLDDDIVPTERLISEHLAWHERWPDRYCGVLGLVKWSPAVRVTPFMRWLETGLQFNYEEIDSLQAPWTHFYSCNVSLKREVLGLTGGFDEERFPYGYEDLDLGRRLADQGFRLLYNESALGWHEKTEDLESWRRNLRRIARAERRFIELYPDMRPYFYERFSRSADAPRARGRAARLASRVSPGVPWLGPLVWKSFDQRCSQALAPEFLAAWREASGV